MVKKELSRAEAAVGHRRFRSRERERASRSMNMQLGKQMDLIAFILFDSRYIGEQERERRLVALVNDDADAHIDLHLLI